MVWERGGPQEDTAFFQPMQIVGNRDQVVLADWGAHRIAAVNAMTGEDVWKFGSRGMGPGEFESLTSLFAMPTGGWIVWDSQVGRLTVVSDEGRLDRMVQLRTEDHPEQICPLPGGQFAALLRDRESPVGVITKDGRVESKVALPWEELADLEPLQRQGRWAATDDSCVLHFVFSTGFGVFDGQGFGTRGTYVEHSSPPEATVEEGSGSRRVRLGVPTLAVHGAVVRGSELWVLFAGSTEDRGRLIDIYDLTTGAYSRTLRLPFHGTGIGVAGDLVILNTQQDGYPLVVALRMPGLGTTPNG